MTAVLVRVSASPATTWLRSLARLRRSSLRTSLGCWPILRTWGFHPLLLRLRHRAALHSLLRLRLRTILESAIFNARIGSVGLRLSTIFVARCRRIRLRLTAVFISWSRTVGLRLH